MTVRAYTAVASPDYEKARLTRREQVRTEYVLVIRGIVRHDEGTINGKDETGKIEIRYKNYEF